MLDKKLTAKSIHKIVAVVAMLSMSACSYARPNARLLNQVPNGAPEEYQQGWKDGCESGMAVVGNDLYKAVYKNKIDPELVQNTQYYRGWDEAKTYCAHYTMATLWESGVLPSTPTQDHSLIPEFTDVGVFSVAAAWGVTTPVSWSGTDLVEEEGDGFAGFSYRN